MKSNGGVLSADEVVHQPITTVLSGPPPAPGAAVVARTGQRFIEGRREMPVGETDPVGGRLQRRHLPARQQLVHDADRIRPGGALLDRRVNELPEGGAHLPDAPQGSPRVLRDRHPGMEEVALEEPGRRVIGRPERLVGAAEFLVGPRRAVLERVHEVQGRVKVRRVAVGDRGWVSHVRITTLTSLTGYAQAGIVRNR